MWPRPVGMQSHTERTVLRRSKVQRLLVQVGSPVQQEGAVISPALGEQALGLPLSLALRSEAYLNKQQ